MEFIHYSTYDSHLKKNFSILKSKRKFFPGGVNLKVRKLCERNYDL